MVAPLKVTKEPIPTSRGDQALVGQRLKPLADRVAADVEPPNQRVLAFELRAMLSLPDRMSLSRLWAMRSGFAIGNPDVLLPVFAMLTLNKPVQTCPDALAVSGFRSRAHLNSSGTTTRLNRHPAYDRPIVVEPCAN